VERLAEGVEEILSGGGSLETLSKMQEHVCQIAAGNVPWHLSEKQLNAELFKVLRRVWNFSLSLENATTNKSERGEYFGMLRYFCVGIALYLVVERGINDVNNGEGEGGNEYGAGFEEEEGTEARMKALTIFQLLKMTLHTGRVCLECVSDAEKAQFCFQIVIQQYSKIRDGGSPEETQIILREIIRILYCNGKIFQSEVEDQEDLKGLLLAASVLSKDCPDEGSCFATLCLRNGVRLAGMSRYRKAAVWLTSATRNAHFLEKDSQALAFRRLAQVYFEWGAIDDFPDVIAGLDKANSLVYHPTGALLKLKIVLAAKDSKDPLDEEIKELAVELIDRVDAGSFELVVAELKSFGFHAAADFALDHALAKCVREQKETHLILNLYLLRINACLDEEAALDQSEHQRPQQQLRYRHQQARASFYQFLTNNANHPHLSQLRHSHGLKLSSKLHKTIWNLAKNCVSRGEFKESIEWYRASLIFLESSSSSSSSSSSISTSSRSQPRFEAKLRRNLAKCFLELGDYSSADEQVDASLALAPHCLLSLYRSFTVRLHSGKGWRETMDAFEMLFVPEEIVKGGETGKKKLAVSVVASSKDEEDSAVNVESVVSLALDETFKSSRVDVIEAVIEKTLGETSRVHLSSPTILVVLRRALLLVLEKRDEKSATKRIEYLKMAFDILKGDIQKSGDGDAGLRQTMLSEVDWFTPMAWNTIGSSNGEASLDNFLLTFKFLALKEVKIRESLESDGASADKPEVEEKEKRHRRESNTSDLHVNLDMQNQMLGSAVDAGLRKVRAFSPGNHADDAAALSTITAPEDVGVGEVLEMLFKVCEKRRRVLAELESLAGPSESLLNCKLMAAIYHFEVCAKSRRHSHMATLLGEIASLAKMTEDSIPSFTIFESLVEFCSEPPADHRLNYLVVCDCFVLAMKARAATGAKCNSSSTTSTTYFAAAELTMPKVFEDALDFVGGITAPSKGEMIVVADRFSACFAQFFSSSTTTSSCSSPSPSVQNALDIESQSPLSAITTKAAELGHKFRREADSDAALKWLRLALTLTKKSGQKELQKKLVAQMEIIAGQNK